MPSETKPFKPMVLLAMALAWLVPGAGHIYLRRRARGLVILVAIGVTFWTGMAMGGAMTYYPEADWWWSSADMLTGVHGLAAWRHHQGVYDEVYKQAMSKAKAQGYPMDSSAARMEMVERELADPNRPLALVAPLDTAARAYSGVAGLMNVLCILDAMFLSLMGRVGEPPLQAKAPQEEAT